MKGEGILGSDELSRGHEQTSSSHHHIQCVLIDSRGGRKGRKVSACLHAFIFLEGIKSTPPAVEVQSFSLGTAGEVPACPHSSSATVFILGNTHQGPFDPTCITCDLEAAPQLTISPPVVHPLFHPCSRSESPTLL